MTERDQDYTPVKIHLTTDITQEGEKESISFTTFGRYYQKGGASFLKYEEVLEEGTVRTIVKIKEDTGLILRGGAVKMRLAFQRESAMNGSYESPHGTFLLETKTRNLRHKQQSDSNGEILLTYDLSMQGTVVGTYKMKLTYKEDVEA
ncbi:DUF1934 domain-containing protein [Bacillus sp. 2205SS5-2]|uniref:DUF1934 domain-containing protein n=1 Tax=Bacillus sp. 2205SS5-2 TaxID=3109031 RepID=UPI003006F048